MQVPTTLADYCISAKPPSEPQSLADLDFFDDDDYLDEDDDDDCNDDDGDNDDEADGDSGNGD